MVTIIILPPDFYRSVAVATAIIAYYLFWKPLVWKRVQLRVTKSPVFQILLHASPIVGYVLDVSFAISLALFPWIVFTYAYPAPLELMEVYTQDVGNHLTLTALLVGASVGLLGLTVTAATVLYLREESRKSVPNFFFWSKWMTRFSLTSTTLAFGSLLTRTMNLVLFGYYTAPPFLLTLSALCFLFQLSLTMPSVGWLTVETLKGKRAQLPEQQGPKTLAGAIIATAGLILMVFGLLFALSLI